MEYRKSLLWKWILCAILCFAFLITTLPVEAGQGGVGWKEENGKQYYYESGNKVAVEWRRINDKWYYFDGSGAMQKGWKKISGHWYYFASSGIMVTGWKKLGKKWYYFDKNGVMASREYRGGYWLTASGEWDEGLGKASWHKNSRGWWYQDKDGWYPRNRWLYINGYGYYFNNRGYLVTGQKVRGYSVNKDGAWCDASGKAILKYVPIKNQDKTVLREVKKNSGTEEAYDSGDRDRTDGQEGEDDLGGSEKQGDTDSQGEKKHVHDWDKGVVLKESTCVEDGEIKYTCSSCGETRIEPIEALGHQLSYGPRVEPQPKKRGHTESVKCWVCGYVEKEEEPLYWDVSQYSYEVTPLLAPLNDWFYIKTDNPEPDSFVFIDKESVYVDDPDSYAAMLVEKDVFEDVEYDDSTISRVKGGYLARCNRTDGGELILCNKYIDYSSDGWYSVHETDVKISLPKLIDKYDYIINKYAPSGDVFFDRMTTIQNGLLDESLYSGIGIRGDLEVSEDRPYYGVRLGYHKDQYLSIYSPYSQNIGGKLLSTFMFPFSLDSEGFPGFMIGVAQRLDPNVTYEWSDYYHYIVNITKDGKTMGFGGAGPQFGAQQILKSQISHRFTFDKGEDDESVYLSVDYLRDIALEYAKLEVPDDPGKTLPELTMEDVKNMVGEGAYIKVVGNTYGENRQRLSSYSYVYIYYLAGTAYLYELTNAWYEGRYYNYYEAFEDGTSFEESLDSHPELMFDRIKLTLPEHEDGCRFFILNSSGKRDYLSDDGVYEGKVSFYYEEETGTWKNELFQDLRYETPDGRVIPVDESVYLDDITITYDEAVEMNLDSNRNVFPSEYLNFDGTVEPGTLVTE